MFDKTITIGRKISPKGVIARKLRAKKKLVVQKRKSLKKRKKRTRLQERLIKQQRRIEKAITIIERPTITAIEGNILFNDVRDALQEMGYSQIFMGGRFRRGMPEAKTLILIVCIDAYNTKHSIDENTFIQKMAQREYLATSSVTTDKYRGASNVFIVEQIPIIIHMANQDNLGAVMLYATGNDMFLRLLSAHASKNCKLQMRKTGVYMNGECIASQTEEEIFEALDLEYHDISERSFTKGCYLKKLF